MNKVVIRDVALIVVFCAAGFILFTNNVRMVQMLGLFACGAVVGASLTNMLTSLKLHNQAR